MHLNSLHILLTYKCVYECEHCFVWGSPQQIGVLTGEQIGQILEQAKEAGVTSIFFEGGEPFLYYPVLVKGVQKAVEMGFEVGIVTNAYWAVSVADAIEWLQPFARKISSLTVSSDLYHCEKAFGELPQNAIAAAKWMNIPTGMISIYQPDKGGPTIQGQLSDESAVMYRGRAATALAPLAPSSPWEKFTECPHEDLREPGRLHVDPLGWLHICQGLVIGNLFEKSLKEISGSYDPDVHPICGLLLAGGPSALVSEYNLPHEARYADACHLCYGARRALRARYPQMLGPDQMYGVFDARE